MGVSLNRGSTRILEGGAVAAQLREAQRPGVVDGIPQAALPWRPLLAFHGPSLVWENQAITPAGVTLGKLMSYLPLKSDELFREPLKGAHKPRSGGYGGLFGIAWIEVSGVLSGAPKVARRKPSDGAGGIPICLERGS